MDKPSDHSFSGHQRDLHEIVAEKLGAESVILVGQSYGAVLVSYFLAHHPDLVEKAVLTSPGMLQPIHFDDAGRPVNETRYPTPPDLTFSPPERPEGWTVSEWPLRVLATVALSTVFDVKLMPDQEADGFLNTLATKVTRTLVCDPDNAPPEEGGMGLYAHGNGAWYGEIEDWRPRLRTSPVPVLVLQGECDFIPYSMAFEHAALAPEGRYRYVPGAGHEIWWDRPDRFVDEIAAFLTTRSTAGSRSLP